MANIEAIIVDGVRYDKVKAKTEFVCDDCELRDMNFNSQICTTKEQSERLLDLGLKKETADMMYCKTSYGESISVKDDDYLEHLDFPAWSLHRLIEMADTYIEFSPYTGVNFQDGTFSTNRDNDYDAIVDIIEWLIQKDHFNKEYLEE